jgi:SAM-dependent methyltransferase
VTRDLRTDLPHQARIYNYMLGEKDNFQVDRDAAAQMIAAWPGIVSAVQANRAYMERVVAYLVGERGIRQFLDIGTGLPTSARPNLHEVAQAIVPEARVIYVDNDPLVLAHARALLAGTPQGVTDYIDADLHRPEDILRAPGFAALDLSEPVAVTMHAILHFFGDEEAAHAIATLMRPLAAGSALSLSIVTADLTPLADELGDAANRAGVQAGGRQFQKTRTLAETLRLFEGLHLVPPGVVRLHHWHADGGGLRDEDVSMYAGVGVKP